jgi:hypothetical protein
VSDFFSALAPWLNIFGVLFGALTAAAMLIWVERRLLAVFQDRYGPNRVGPFGLLQVVADMIKIFTKEDWIPPFADKPVFIIAPAIVMATVLMSFAVIPFAPGGWRCQLQHRPAVLPGHVVVERVQRDAGRLVLEQQIFPAGRDALGGADAQLRSLHGAVAGRGGGFSRFLSTCARLSRRRGGSGFSSRSFWDLSHF